MSHLVAMCSTLRQLLLRLMIALVGRWSWQQPPWLQAILRYLTAFWHASRKRPVYSAGVLLGMISVAAAVWYGYDTWQKRPQPVSIDFTVSTIERTAIENAEAPHPLTVNFAGSVAPLDKVGQDVSEGIDIEPKVAGTWHWQDDQTLQFQPSSDWDIGVRYNVTLAKTVLAPQVRLARYEFEFSTPEFTAALEKSEFYQDIVEPSIKQALFQLHFSHPVNTAQLEKQVQLSLNSVAGAASAAKSLKFTLTFDKLKLNAYIRSETLAIPREDQVVNLAVRAGVQAAAGAASYPEAINVTLDVPGLYRGLQINDVQFTVTPNLQTQAQDQVLVINTSLPVHEQQMLKAVQVWQLPEFPPNVDVDKSQTYQWGQEEVTEAVLKQSTPVALTLLPAEHEYTQLHSIQVHAEVNRTLWVKIHKDVSSLGGYLLADDYYQTVLVTEYPKQLHIMGEGSLLSLSGDKKIALMARDVAGVKIELGRVLPEQLQHLVSQTEGDFGHPQFLGDFGQDNLSERFAVHVPLTAVEKGKPHYQPVDLSQYMVDAQGQNKRGIFLLTATDYDPEQQQAETTAESETEHDEAYSAEDDVSQSVEDKRLIVVTDLGIIAKTELNGAQVVFVQSIQSGQPQEGVTVEVIAKNGLVLMRGTTDAEGKVRFNPLSGLERERQPMYYLARLQGDMSFLPLAREDRKLNLTRFEIGGAENATDANQLDAYLFSDRGIYRPGDTINIGMIVKTSGWNTPLVGMPLEAEILDARGLTVKRVKLNLEAGGFNSLSYETLESSPTGIYSVNLYTVKDGNTDQFLGDTTVKVEEFQPDRMKIKAKFSAAAAEGWVHPQDLKALVQVDNLYGAPAEARKVTAEMSLKPVLTAFKRYKSYSFYDPHYAKEGYQESLTPMTTNANGEASFALGLEKYQRATYQLNLVTQAFEAEGGRSVAAEASVLVSDMPYLVGYKSDGALSFVAKDAERHVRMIAIDPQLQLTQADSLTLELQERKVLSVLTRQEDNTYRYESRPKEVSLHTEKFTLPATGYDLRLESKTPGDYSYVVRDAAGLVLSKIDYSVAGQGNVSRSLDRNAELQLTLDKAEYAPGDDITVNIRAPYTGAGLITIERDKVYASTWFKADTQASVQRITVPKELMGNAYVSVQFMREPGSDEVFMSPLSYGVVPFKVSLAQHTADLKLQVPEHVKPGQTLDIHVQSAEPTRVVVFAVDEGILQVARYKTPDPLGHFFQKRQLAVDTTQILDLILPEFKKLLQLSAAGGDGGDDEAGSLLNPFKRKHDQPAVYWSGIVNLDKSATLQYQVPETFNGSLRVMAVAVNDQRIASVVQQTQVRDDLIITPNAPFMAAPGDEFSVSVAVANHSKNSGADVPIQLKLEVPSQFQILGAAEQTLTVAEGHEAVASFRLKTQDAKTVTLGNARLTFTASGAGHTVQRHVDLSVRPASPRMTTLRFGAFKNQQDVAIQRRLYPQERKVSAGLSPLPLVAVSGLTDYLDNFEHSCTEQLVSKAIPALVLERYPEFNAEINSKLSEANRLKLFGILRSRQNADGGFGLWHATPQAHEFASVYSLHLLQETLSHDKAIPDDMLQKALAYAETLAASPSNTLDGLRVRAYAAYLLTRQGNVTTTLLAGLRESLHANFEPKLWQQDLTAVYLAASYQLLQQQKMAQELLQPLLTSTSQQHEAYRYQSYYDPLIRDAQLLYLLAKHFPAELAKLPASFMPALAKALQEQHYNTLSSAYFLLAYQAYSEAVPAELVKQLALKVTDTAGQQQNLALTASIAPRASFPVNTQSLHFQGPDGLQLYYAVSEAGFDQLLPTKPSAAGIEIQRTYLNKAGKPVEHVALGEEISVQIRLRALERERINDLAIQDLLPAGFEVVLPTASAVAAENDNAAEAELPAWRDRLMTGGNWQNDYVDVREDRVLLYGAATDSIAEYRYTLKANTAGVFTVPPIYVQSLYESMLQAYSMPGLLRVE